MSTTSKKTETKSGNSGKLKIGNDWNAITIIALSQNNPLKAIAEFVENSIDAKAKSIVIIRGKERGENYLRIIDDGTGIPLDDEGLPDFKYVATHICDSIKKQLKKEGLKGVQGEFGIGLLSFWTVGEQLVFSSAGSDGRTYQMEMRRNSPGYKVSPKRALFGHQGSELVIHPLLSGLRQLSGEKIQNYLSSELRDRIRNAGVKIVVKDRLSRKEYDVQPKQFQGRFLHSLDSIETRLGDISLELYLNTLDPGNEVSLSRHGTRVVPAIAKLDELDIEPWTSGYLQGTIEAPFLNLTPGTRDGIIHNEGYAIFVDALKTIEEDLIGIIVSEKNAEEEKASKDILKSVQRAFKEAFQTLPREEYGWLDIAGHAGHGKKHGGQLSSGDDPGDELKDESGGSAGVDESDLIPGLGQEPKFYEIAGPLHTAIISPGSSVMKVESSKSFRVIARDKSKRVIETNVAITWAIKEGAGSVSGTTGEIVAFIAPLEPGITILEATVTQGETLCKAEAVVTITDSLVEKQDKPQGDGKGLPDYTFKRAPGELWRSYLDDKNNIIVINNGHADYIFASRKQTRKLKYICKLYTKELVIRNFPGFKGSDLLDRMVELSLYTEEHLK
jgi:hypothetical protein